MEYKHESDSEYEIEYESDTEYESEVDVLDNKYKLKNFTIFGLDLSGITKSRNDVYEYFEVSSDICGYEKILTPFERRMLGYKPEYLLDKDGNVDIFKCKLQIYLFFIFEDLNFKNYVKEYMLYLRRKDNCCISVVCKHRPDFEEETMLYFKEIFCKYYKQKYNLMNELKIKTI